MNAHSESAIRRARYQDAPRIARLFAAAFHRDPVFDWLARDGKARAPALQRFFHWILEDHTLAHGECWISADGQAAAAWVPPHAGAAARRLGQDLRILPAVLQLTGFSKFSRSAAMAAALDGKSPAEPFFHLAFLGVNPAAQGKGLGSTLLATMLARVDGLRANAYLENSNPRNLRLYEREGFSVTAEIKARKDAPPVFAMWRPRRDQGSRTISQ
ncbi:MAG: N-acetyltransferase [Alphaproteobacteria bacterium]|nr:N-acetyltransferase [Alphaproteobacteria bacterium]